MWYKILNKHPKISVILPIYKEPNEYIQSSIESILSQTYSNFELILAVDTGVDSPEFDRVYKVLEQYLKDDRVNLLINEQNIGLPMTLNKSIKIAKGEYIARMDADDIALPERLEIQMEHMEKNPELDLIGTKVFYINQEGKITGESKSLDNNDLLKRLFSGINPLCHPTWLFKKEVWEAVNGYRNITTIEDYDFLCRLILKGFNLGIINRPLLKYRIDYRVGRISKKRTMQLALTLAIAKEFRKGKILSDEKVDKILNKKINPVIIYLDSISQALDNLLMSISPQLHYYLKWLVYFISPYKARHILEAIYYMHFGNFNKNATG